MPFYDDNEPIGFREVGHRPGLRITPGPATDIADPLKEPLLPPIDGRPATVALALPEPRVAFEPSEAETAVLGPARPDPTARDRYGLPLDIGPDGRPKPSVLDAAFRRENMIGSAMAAIDTERNGPVDPTHNPFATIKGTPYEAEWRQFVSSRNQDQTDAIIEQIRREQEDRRTIEDAGWGGVAASVLATIFDPTVLLPVGGMGYRASRVGTIAVNAARVGAASAGATAVQEVGLQATQLTRTGMESAFNIGGAAVLGALLGGGLAGLTATEARRLGARLDDIMRVPEDGKADPFGMGGLDDVQLNFGTGGRGGLSAQLVEGKPAVALAGGAGSKAVQVANVINRDPVIRILTSPLKSAREAGTMLFETVLGLTRNAEGVTTAPVGGAVETRIKMRTADLGRAIVEMEDAFKQYRFGKTDVKFAAARAGFANMTGQGGGQMNWKEFKTEVARAWARNDKHDVPEVAKMAKRLREVVFNARAKEAVELDLLPPEVLGLPPKPQPTKTPAWGSKAHTEQTQNTSLIEGVSKALGIEMDPDAIGQAVSTLGRVNPPLLEALQNMFARYAGNVTDAEIKNIRDAFAKVQAAKGVKKPPQRSWIDALEDEEKNRMGEGVLGPDRGAALFRKAAADARAHLEKNGVVKAANEEDAVAQFIAARTARPAPAHAIPGTTAAAGAKEPTLALVEALQKTFNDAMNHPSAAPPPEPPKFFSGETANEIWGDGGQSYVTRIYNKTMLASNEGYAKFKKILVAHFQAGQQRAEAVMARQMRRAAEGGEAGDLKALSEFASLTQNEVEDIAAKVISNILGAPDGRMLFELPDTVRGPLKSRMLRIKDELIEEFLERDAEVILRYYNRTMATDIEMVRAFGSLDMAEAFAKIGEEADQQALLAPKNSKSVMDEKAAALSDLEDIADRIRGTYALPENPMAWGPRILRGIRTWNYLRLLGGMTLSAIPDVFRPMMVHGITTYFQDGWLPLVRNLSEMKMAASEVKLAGAAWDMVLDTRAMAMADVLDDFGRYSKFERGLQSAQQNFGMISLMAPWNAMLKQWAGAMGMSKMLKAVLRLADGAPSAKDIEMLAASSIDAPTARLIAEQFRKHGAIGDSGLHLPNSEVWDDTVQALRAKEAMRAAIVRDVDRTIITPGQEKPLWMSTQYGMIAGQFKAFPMASIQRTILAGMQQRDAGVLVGMMGMVAMGAVAVAIRDLANKQEVKSRSPGEWAAEAISRSGLTAYLFDVNHFVERTTRGAYGLAALQGKPISKYASRNWADSVLGPTAGMIQDTLTTVGDVADGDGVSDSSIRALRRTLPYQNLFYASWLFNQLEKSAGVKPRGH